MNVRGSILAAVIALNGCASEPTVDESHAAAAVSLAALPQSDRAFAVEQAPVKPTALLASIESTATADPGDARTDFVGIDRLVHPTTTSLTVAWNYVRLGRAYAASGYSGAAARAYWAAISLTSKSLGSRPDREFIREQAFRDLQALAEAKHQMSWALALQFMADLHSTYLGSENADDDDAGFYSEIAQLRDAAVKSADAQQELRNAQHAQHSHNFSNGLLVALSAANAGLSGNSADLSQAQQYADNAAATESADDRRVSAATAHFNDVLSALTSRGNEFRDASIPDVDDLQAGRSMLAEEFHRHAVYFDNPVYRAAVVKYQLLIPELANATTSEDFERGLRAFEIRAARERTMILMAANSPGRLESAMLVQPASAPVLQAEIAAWKSIETSTDPSDYQRYARDYPNGIFAARAKSRAADPTGFRRILAKANPLDCEDVRGASTDLELYGRLSYNYGSPGAGQLSQWDLTWGVTNNFDNGHSGSLKVKIWAVERPFDGNKFSGYEIAEFLPSFTGQGAYSTNQVNAGWHWNDISGHASGHNPPIGRYCIVAVLYEYSTDHCSDASHFCWNAWVQFPGAKLFE